MSYFFQIAQMKTEDMDDLSLQNVVTQVTATMVVDYRDKRTLKTRTITLTKPTSASSFTNFNDLTEAQVTQWVENTLGSEEVTAMYEKAKSRLDDIIDSRATNTVNTPPWLTPSGT